MLWVTVTLPTLTLPGEYYGSIVRIYHNSFNVQDIPLTINVPCWTTVGVLDEEVALWDYSGRPNSSNNENEEILLDGPSSTLESSRAERRTHAAHNTLYWPIGVPSRLQVGGSINPAFALMVSRLADDLGRYDIDESTSSPERIRRIVLGLNAADMFEDYWGYNPVYPGNLWGDAYREHLLDLEMQLQLNGVEMGAFEWVVIPQDEPDSGVYVWGAIPNVYPGTTITKKDYFRAAAAQIRFVAPLMKMNPQILVNFAPDSVVATTFIDDYEHCYGIASDCVDIWMEGNWAEEDPWEDPIMGALASDDQHWVYEFADEWRPAMRHLQAGWQMKRHGITGTAQWSFTSANDQPNRLDVVHQDRQYDPYVPHTWQLTVPRLWSQWNSVYLHDASTPSWIPDSEEIMPGRAYLARRQGLEYDRLLRKLEDVPGFQLTPAGEFVLGFIVERASDQCHVTGDCPVDTATSDDLSLVLHRWLDRVYDCPSEPPSTPCAGERTMCETSHYPIWIAAGMNPWEVTP